MGALAWLFGEPTSNAPNAPDTGWIKLGKTTEAEVRARLGNPSKVLRGDDFLSHGGDFFADTLVYPSGLKIDVTACGRDRLIKKIAVGGIDCVCYSIAGGYLQGAR